MRILERAGQKQVDFPATVSSPYVNTIPSDEEPEFPGDEYLERRIRAFIRWNAAVMVVRANVRSEAIGGHLSTYASSACLYEVGFNHFFRGKDDGRPGDQVYFQGHASPGIYARAFVEGRLSEEQLDNFRFEVGVRRALLLPPSAADARLLGVPDGFDGPRARSTPSPRPTSAVTSTPGRWPTPRTAGSGASSATASSTSPRPSALWAWPGASTSTTWCSWSTATSSGSTARSAGNGKVIQEFEALFRGAGLERDQGDLGSDLGRAAGQGRRGGPAQQDELDRRRRVPEVRHRVGRLHPGALLRPRPAPGRTGGPPLRRGAADRCPGAATTTGSSTPPTRRPPNTSVRRPPSWPRRSRGGRSARRSRPAMPPTRSRR